MFWLFKSRVFKVHGSRVMGPVLLLMLLAFSSHTTITGAAQKLQPVLAQLAVERPAEAVGVIVQKTAKDSRVEERVAQLGGTVTKDLHIINAFAAELPANALPQLAQADGVKWVSLDAPVQQSGGPGITKFTTWATSIGTTVPNGFTSASNVLSPVGINKTYGYGKNVKGAFGGFAAEYTPGNAITKVEVALRLYVPNTLAATETPKLKAYVGGVSGATYTVPVSSISPYTSTANAGTVYFDITSTRAWKWSDFKNNLEILVDQSALSNTHLIYYDAIGLRVSTMAGTDSTSPLLSASTLASLTVDTSVLSNKFNQAVRATDVWSEAPTYLEGQDVTVAVVDSGVFGSKDMSKRLLGEVNFNSSAHNSNDQYGHGTFVAGIVADDGTLSSGQYVGTAIRTNVLSVRVSDDQGMAYESDVVNGLQWVYDNRATYNIRVVNLSMNSSIYESYHTSPLDAAAEILWFNGIVVVASAGNNGTATLYPPANDPFVITVGATNDAGTVSLGDDVVASFSAYGTDENGGVKPDLVAPGMNLIGYLPDNNNLSISINHPANRVDSNYFRMSGTSVSAPIVSGAAAMLLQDEPNLNPDQVKYRLKATANTSWAGYDATKAGAGYLDVYAAVHGATTATANTGLPASQLLWTGSTPATWGSVNWTSVNWTSVNWTSVNWTSVNWTSVNWSSDYWGP